MQEKRYMVKILMAGLLFFAFSCHKDEQTYNYTEINNLTVEETNETSRFTISINDSLIIRPNLKESEPSGDPIVHEWMMGDSVISTDKHFRMLVTQSIGSHNIRYKATNTRTGVQALMQYYLTVRGTYYAGYYVAHNKNGKAEFSFIREDGMLFSNPLEEVNAKTYGGQAFNIVFSINSPTAVTGVGTVLAWTSDNVWRFDGNTLEEINDVSTWFPEFTDFPLTTKGNHFQAIADLHC